MARKAAVEAEATTTWASIGALRMERHHLARRAGRSQLLDVVHDLVGIQAQVMSSAELALNARIDGLRPDDVRDALWTHRTLVKTWAMRGTLHLVDAAGLPALVGALASREGWRSPVWQRYFGVTTMQMEELLDAFGEVLAGTPMTKARVADAIAKRVRNEALGKQLRSGWGTFLKPAAMRGSLAYGPDDGRNVTYVDPRDWLGVEMPTASEAALADVLERHVRVFPGTTLEGLARWWGVSVADVRVAVELMDARLVVVDVDRERTFVRRDDLGCLETGATMSDGADLRLVGAFDAYVFALTRAAPALLPVPRRPLISRTAGWITPAVIVHGAIVGTWSHDVRRERLVVEVTPWRRLSGAERTQLTAEADRIGRFLDRPVHVEQFAVLAAP